MNFSTAPRSLSQRRIPAPTGASWCAMSIRAGAQGYHTPVHRLGYDMARTVDSMLDAFARHEMRVRLMAEHGPTSLAVLRHGAQGEPATGFTSPLETPKDGAL